MYVHIRYIHTYIPFNLMTDGENKLVVLVHQQVTITEYYDIIEHLSTQISVLEITKNNSEITISIVRTWKSLHGKVQIHQEKDNIN